PRAMRAASEDEDDEDETDTEKARGRGASEEGDEEADDDEDDASKAAPDEEDEEADDDNEDDDEQRTSQISDRRGSSRIDCSFGPPTVHVVVLGLVRPVAVRLFVDPDPGSGPEVAVPHEELPHPVSRAKQLLARDDRVGQALGAGDPVRQALA